MKTNVAKLSGKIALVAGASSGIGEATAQRLATAGYKVYGTSRRGARSGLVARLQRNAALPGGHVDVLHAQTKGLHRPPRSVLKKTVGTPSALDAS